MKIKSFLAKPYAIYANKQIKKSMLTAVADQENIFNSLIKTATKTEFGKEHQFEKIKTHADFVKNVPIREYEDFKEYIDKIKQGKHNVLWKGVPIYFAKTSGTTSGIKYIPITKDSIPNHINTARNALLCYMAQSGNTQFANGKMIFLSGTPELERIGGVPTGRLSGIVNHHIPRYLRSNQLPSFETNCIDDWEEKLSKIVEETLDERMTLISGIPPWMQMYFDELQKKTGKKIKDIFPDFSVMVQGGVNFEPYKAKLFESIGKKIDVIELYPASEGFFAFQYGQEAEGLLLNTDSGIFYEFIPVEDIENENPRRLTLKEVELNKNYVLIITSNAGLWAYNIGDTVRFVSLNPYRIVVTGRVKHFISAFGEHVIGEEVEEALMKAADSENIKITEFTVAPNISKTGEKSFHEWYIEFEKTPGNLEYLAERIDNNLRKKNIYYDDLIKGNILQPLKIEVVQKNGFINYMKSEGKLGGQNKVPRLSNDRKLATALRKWIIPSSAEAPVS
ncbi:MAG: GH3 auxin-responsive promoter family protein [Bacteroidota bacterium]|nr:GH3 auxin-responsive promoter family protein [Bacteroidota bacterium]